MKALLRGAFMVTWCLGCPFGLFVLVFVFPAALLTGHALAELGILAWAPLIPLVCVTSVMLMDRRAAAARLPRAKAFLGKR